MNQIDPFEGINAQGGVGDLPYGPDFPTLMSFDEWLQYGMENSYCGPPVCVTHDGFPTTLEEDDLLDEGTDECIHMIRPYRDVAERLLVEENHSPSIWRRAGWE